MDGGRLLDRDLWVRTRILTGFCGCAARLCLVPCAGLCAVDRCPRGRGVFKDKFMFGMGNTVKV